MNSKGSFQSATIAIASVCANLVNRQFQFTTLEEELVISAIRRSSNKLADASNEEIGEYIGSLSPSSLVGFGNNVKGIYHELLFAHIENTDGDEISARLFEATNHPGADVQLLQNGIVFDEIQLKSTDQIQLVERHFERYPEIPVAATDEVASKMEDVQSSGFTDAEMESEVAATLGNLSDDNALGHAEDVVGTSGLLSAALQAKAVLRGEKSINKASEQALQDMGVAVTSSFLIDLMFS